MFLCIPVVSVVAANFIEYFVYIALFLFEAAVT